MEDPVLTAASDEEQEEEYESEESDDCGPMRQAWGQSQLKWDNRRFDFETNLPEDGEQFLIAVRKERQVTPSWVSADVIKVTKTPRAKKPVVEDIPIDSAIERVKEDIQKTEETLEDKVTDDVDFELEVLELNDEVTKELKDWNHSNRFRPSAKWRANQLTNFQYMRAKIETTKKMMAEGSFYVVAAYETFEKDAIYWLRYCFGTVNSARMIELKRAKKSRKLEAKRKQNLSLKAEDGMAASDSEEDPGSQDEDNQVEESSSEKLEKPQIQIQVAETKSTTEAAPVATAEGKIQEDLKVVSAESENAPPPGEEDKATESLPEPDITDLTACFDSVREASKLYGNYPLTTLLLSMPQNLVTFLLSLNLKWLQDFGIMTKRQGTWIYALMSSLDVPFDSSVISDLRCIALQCAQRRDEFLAHVKKVQCELPLDAVVTCSCSSSEDLDTACDFVLLKEDEDYTHEDVIATCNLIIGLVVDHFVQKDLEELISIPTETST